MAKIIQLKPKEKFKMLKRRSQKILPFLTKEERKREKYKKELRDYILEEDRDLSKKPLK